jgi:hypothetical protein
MTTTRTSYFQRVGWGALLGVLAIGSAPLSYSDTIVLEPTRDNTLYENPTGSVSNGQGQFFFAGRTVQPQNAIRRGLLQFDIDGNVPANATIDGVTLSLTNSRTISGSQTVGLHRALSDWGEGASDASGQEGGGAQAAPGDATWLHAFFRDELWITGGGDFEAAASASLAVAGVGSYTWGSTPQMVADVQSWLDDPGDNFGWFVLGTEVTSGTAKRFNSREHLSAGSRPRLTVDFTPLPVTLTWDGQGDGDWDSARWIGGNLGQTPNQSTAAVVRVNAVTVTPDASALSVLAEDGGRVVVPADVLFSLVGGIEVRDGGGLEIEAGGTLEFQGAVVFRGGSTLVSGIGSIGKIAGLGESASVVIDPGSTLQLKVDGSSPFLAGTFGLFELAESAAIDGTFDAVSGLGEYVTGDGLTYADNAVVLTVDHDLNPGDANLDTITDVRDFNVWNAHKFTDNTEWTTGDFNGDGITDVRDFNQWNAAKFTTAVGPGPGINQQVPEPASLILLAVAALALATCALCRRPA